MKTNMLTSRVFSKMTLAAALLLTAAVPAQAVSEYLTFTGGNGTPLSITFTTPLSFTITADPEGQNAPCFNIAELGDLFNAGWPSATSTLQYTINGGAAITPDTINSGWAGGGVAGTDVYFYSSSGLTSSLAINDTIVLSAGTVTSNSDVVALAPTDGNFDVFLSQSYGKIISTGTAIPEPSTVAMWLGGAALLGAALYRRRKAA